MANLDQWIAQASVCVTSPYPCTHNVIAQHFRLLYCLPQRIFVRDSLLFVCLLSKEYCTIFVQIHSIRLEYSDNHGKGIRARRIGRKKTTLSWNERRFKWRKAIVAWTWQKQQCKGTTATKRCHEDLSSTFLRKLANGERTLQTCPRFDFC